MSGQDHQTVLQPMGTLGKCLLVPLALGLWVFGALIWEVRSAVTGAATLMRRGPRRSY
jgi:hypothetical protein